MLWLSPLFLLTGLVLTIVELPHILPGHVLRDAAVSAITETLGVPAEIRSLQYDPLKGVVLEGIRIGPPQGFERDLFRAERLELRYDLSGALSRRVRIEALTLDAPVIVLETKNARTNVDAVLAHLAKGSSAAPITDDAPPTVGPLLPLDLLLDDLHIGPLTFEMVGEGPNATISQVWLQVQGEAGRKRLDVQAKLRTDAASEPGLRVLLPAQEGQGETEAEGDLGLGLDLHLVAETSRGLAVQDLQAELRFDPQARVRLDKVRLPDLKASLRMGLRLKPPQDELSLTTLSLDFSRAPVLRANAQLLGLRAALKEQMGALAAVTLSEAVGLVAGREQARLTLDLPLLSLPMDELSPFAAIFLPKARLGGRVLIQDLKVSGAPQDLQQGLPEEASAQLSFEDLKAYLPQQMLDLKGVQGALTLVRDHEDPGFALDGTLNLSALSTPQLEFHSGAVKVDGHLPRLAYPVPGIMRLGLGVTLFKVRAPPATLDELSFTARLEGRDLLHALREPAEAITVQSDLRTLGLVVQTGTVAPYRVPTLALSLNAELDQLMSPAQEPITVRARLQIPTVTGPQALALDRTDLTLRTQLIDPRRGFPTQTQAELQMTVGRLAQGPMELQGAKAEWQVSFPGRGVMGTGPLAGILVPTRVDTRLSFSSRRLLGRAELKGLDSPLSLSAEATAQLDSGRVRVSKLVFELAEALKLTGRLTARRALSPDPWVALRLDLEEAKLGPLLSRLPVAYKGAYPDAVGAGSVKAALQFEGKPSDLQADLDLRTSPVRLLAELDFDKVGLRSESQALVLEDLLGKTRLELGPDGFVVANHVDVRRLEMGQGEAHRALLGTRLAQQLGYEDDQWRVASTLEVETVEGASWGKGEVSGVSSEVLVLYALGGDLEVPIFSVRAQSAGLQADLRARLSRGEYGVLLPELKGEVWVDFDRLRAVLPQVAGLSGRLATELDVRSEGATGVQLEGSLALADFGYTDGVSTIEGAFGHMPLRQTLRLSAPEFDDKVATTVGRLGDDFEARLDEMQARFQAVQGLFSTEDVILVPPRHADHNALRPYRRRNGADLRIEKLTFDRYTLESVVAEAHWRAGVLRLDHFEAALWDGDLLADMAVQLTPSLDVRARIRGTVTNLNLDIPYAVATGRIADTSEGGEKYQTSATMDLSFALKERTLNGRVEITKLSQALVERLFGGLSLSGGGGAIKALGWSERVGVRPIAAKVWIAQNLLNVQFEWSRLWLHLYYPDLKPWMLVFDTFLFVVRPVLIPTLGGLYVIPTVNGAIHRLSLSGFMDQIFAQYQPEARLQVLTPYVAAEPSPEAD